MDKEVLAQKILEFVDTTDGELFDEWYTTEREIAASVLADFAKHIGLEIVIPEYIPQQTRKAILLKKQRQEFLRELLPEVEKLFDLRYKEHMEKIENEPKPNQDLCGND